MNEHDFGARQKLQKWNLRPAASDKLHQLLSAEEQLLHLISNRASLPEILNGICAGLDRQMANVVSIISLVPDNAVEFPPITLNENSFGLYGFCSKSIVNYAGELLGALEIFCSFPRSPSVGEYQLIARASCLAALAIESHRHAEDRAALSALQERSVRWTILDWPASLN